MSWTDDPQKIIEWERMVDDRCPRCGSKRVAPGDYYMTPDGDMPIGTSCTDCEFWEIGGPEVWKDAPFIMPGDAGSHDQPSDYPTA